MQCFAKQYPFLAVLEKIEEETGYGDMLSRLDLESQSSFVCYVAICWPSCPISYNSISAYQRYWLKHPLSRLDVATCCCHYVILSCANIYISYDLQLVLNMICTLIKMLNGVCTSEAPENTNYELCLSTRWDEKIKTLTTITTTAFAVHTTREFLLSWIACLISQCPVQVPWHAWPKQ